jgi:hypothetical protein
LYRIYTDLAIGFSSLPFNSLLDFSKNFFQGEYLNIMLNLKLIETVDYLYDIRLVHLYRRILLDGKFKFNSFTEKLTNVVFDIMDKELSNTAPESIEYIKQQHFDIIMDMRDSFTEEDFELLINHCQSDEVL